MVAAAQNVDSGEIRNWLTREGLRLFLKRREGISVTGAFFSFHFRNAYLYILSLLVSL